ncbi:DUF6069 family protein [Planosporangium mesophilum]|uniref:Uncharacterized protein n=1 Tax=Planosporangium mesophilum TaxID=689768 RepID=A0A8J3TH75_9ACTN|nr:DUF6069 family protein [Planosporangium mesophilum]NJC82885.1 hypothetical protein [Planosporangium mesophilum]GII24659.1 hypothetical protein Pme01_42560 [Planosporangium mesophilum]
MTATSVPASTATTDARRRRRLTRAASVIGASCLTSAIFAIGRAAGTDFTITDPGPDGQSHTFVLPEIAIITLIIGLAGWATLAVLERFTSRARVIWIALATVIVLLSLPPIWIEQATTGTRALLAVIHVAVGLALIPMVRVPARRG